MDRTTSILVAAAVTLAALMATVLLLTHRRPESGPSDRASAAEREYLQKLGVTDVHLSEAQNFLGDTVTYLEARITNQGDRALHSVALRIELHDELNQVILRETARPISPRTAPLRSGESRQFRVSFEHIPSAWNRAAPDIRPVAVSF
jgi:hypothetical protein